MASASVGCMMGESSTSVYCGPSLAGAPSTLTSATAADLSKELVTPAGSNTWTVMKLDGQNINPAVVDAAVTLPALL